MSQAELRASLVCISLKCNGLINNNKWACINPNFYSCIQKQREQLFRTQAVWKEKKNKECHHNTNEFQINLIEIQAKQ